MLELVNAEKIGLSESAVRRRAQREGYIVRKSRDGGGYALFDRRQNIPVLGWDYDASLADIGNYLAD